MRWLYLFDCLTVTKPTILLLQGHMSSVNQWGECIWLIVSQWQNQQYCFYRTIGPLVSSEVTVHIWFFHSDKTNNVVLTGPLVLCKSVRWLYMFDCITVTKPTLLLVQEHWSSGNQWGDCTCLIVSRSNMYSHLNDYQRTSGPVKTTLLVLSLWDNQTCTVTSLITRGPVVL